MQDIQAKGLDDVVPMVVPLQSADPDGAILMDLAVFQHGVSRVLQSYGPLNFVPLSDNDPIMIAQTGDTLESKRANGYAYIHQIYLDEYTENCCLAKQLGYELSEPTTLWFNMSLRRFSDESGIVLSLKQKE